MNNVEKLFIVKQGNWFKNIIKKVIGSRGHVAPQVAFPNKKQLLDEVFGFKGWTPMADNVLHGASGLKGLTRLNFRQLRNQPVVKRRPGTLSARDVRKGKLGKPGKHVNSPENKMYTHTESYDDIGPTFFGEPMFPFGPMTAFKSSPLLRTAPLVAGGAGYGFAKAKEAASIRDAELNMPAPNYMRSPDPSKICGNCRFRDQEGYCNAYNFDCRQEFVCDSWSSQV